MITVGTRLFFPASGRSNLLDVDVVDESSKRQKLGKQSLAVVVLDRNLLIDANRRSSK